MKHLFVILALLTSTLSFAGTRIVDVTPVLTSFATPYDINDVLGGVNTVVSFTGPHQGVAALGSLILIDKAKQKKDTEICFYSSSPTISADNAAFDLTDAMALNTIGCVSIAAADYIDSASNSTATKRGLSLVMPSYASGQTIYAVFITRGAPTYASVGDLVARMAFYEE